MRKRIPMQQAVFMLGGDDGRRDNSLSSSSSSPMISSSAASSSSESLSASNLLPPRRPLVVLRPLPPGLPPDRPCIESPRAIFFAVTRLRPVGRAAAFRYAEGCSPTDSSERCVGFLTDGGRAGGRAQVQSRSRSRALAWRGYIGRSLSNFKNFKSGSVCFNDALTPPPRAGKKAVPRRCAWGRISILFFGAKTFLSRVRMNITDPRMGLHGTPRAHDQHIRESRVAGSSRTRG